MYSSSEVIELCENSELLAKKILKTEIGQAYVKAKRLLENDHMAQSLILQFTKCRDLFEEIEKRGKYHPDYKMAFKNLSDSLYELESCEVYKNLKICETEFEKFLNEIAKLLFQGISPKFLAFYNHKTGNEKLQCPGNEFCKGKDIFI